MMGTSFPSHTVEQMSMQSTTGPSVGYTRPPMHRPQQKGPGSEEERKNTKEKFVLGSLHGECHEKMLYEALFGDSIFLFGRL